MAKQKAKLPQPHKTLQSHMNPMKPVRTHRIPTTPPPWALPPQLPSLPPPPPPPLTPQSRPHPVPSPFSPPAPSATRPYDPALHVASLRESKSPLAEGDGSSELGRDGSYRTRRQGRSGRRGVLRVSVLLSQLRNLKDLSASINFFRPPSFHVAPLPPLSQMEDR